MAMLIKQGLIIKDPWTRVQEPLDDYRGYPWFSIVPLSNLSDPSQWPLAQTWIGVSFDASLELSETVEGIFALPLLNIDICDPEDSRVYMLALTLKSQNQFWGDLRVSGNFRTEHMPLLAKSGVDSFAMPASSDCEQALQVLREVSNTASISRCLDSKSFSLSSIND